MSNAFLGEIRAFPYNFAPRGWAFCNGQLLPISQNQALFSLLGTTYGGDGQITFALPDLRGRAAISSGQGPGLSNYILGEETGTESVTLTTNQLPAHTHPSAVSSDPGTSPSPAGKLPARGGAYGTTNPGAAAATQVGAAGGGQPHTNLPPTLTINYCIALQGIFPSRN
jgi:microcystin-dependent protein